ADAGMRGRVMALYIMIFMGTNPVAAPFVGWLAGRYGPRSAFWLGGVVTLLAATVALTYQLRQTGGTVRLRLRPLPAFHVVVPEPAECRGPVPALSGAGDLTQRAAA
ncbi:MAG TPA: hypothetical protein VHA75_20140, partial [Rugosimonospora sp.]|nr:hypothetical protein [Rugosimonospora sp.]